MYAGRKVNRIVPKSVSRDYPSKHGKVIKDGQYFGFVDNNNKEILPPRYKILIIIEDIGLRVKTYKNFGV